MAPTLYAFIIFDIIVADVSQKAYTIDLDIIFLIFILYHPLQEFFIYMFCSNAEYIHFLEKRGIKKFVLGKQCLTVKGKFAIINQIHLCSLSGGILHAGDECIYFRHAFPCFG